MQTSAPRVHEINICVGKDCPIPEIGNNCTYTTFAREKLIGILQSIPLTNSEHWIEIGFCVNHDKYDEMDLEIYYQEMRKESPQETEIRQRVADADFNRKQKEEDARVNKVKNEKRKLYESLKKEFEGS